MGIPINNKGIPGPNVGAGTTNVSHAGHFPTPYHPPAGGNREAGSDPVRRQASPVKVPSDRFDVDRLRADMARANGAPGVITPGPGAVPIQPTCDGGAAVNLAMFGRRV